MCLAGPAAERCYVGTITDGSDQVDLAMARDYLARRLHPVQIGAALARLQTAADSLVRTPWAKDRIRIIAPLCCNTGRSPGTR
jgi:hypothetical protein